MNYKYIFLVVLAMFCQMILSQDLRLKQVTLRETNLFGASLGSENVVALIKIHLNNPNGYELRGQMIHGSTVSLLRTTLCFICRKNSFRVILD